MGGANLPWGPHCGQHGGAAALHPAPTAVRAGGHEQLCSMVSGPPAGSRQQAAGRPGSGSSPRWGLAKQPVLPDRQQHSEHSRAGGAPALRGEAPQQGACMGAPWGGGSGQGGRGGLGASGWGWGWRTGRSPPTWPPGPTSASACARWAAGASEDTAPEDTGAALQMLIPVMVSAPSSPGAPGARARR